MREDWQFHVEFQCCSWFVFESRRVESSRRGSVLISANSSAIFQSLSSLWESFLNLLCRTVEDRYKTSPRSKSSPQATSSLHPCLLLGLKPLDGPRLPNCVTLNVQSFFFGLTLSHGTTVFSHFHWIVDMLSEFLLPMSGCYNINNYYHSRTIVTIYGSYCCYYRNNYYSSTTKTSTTAPSTTVIALLFLLLLLLIPWFFTPTTVTTQ